MSDRAGKLILASESSSRRQLLENAGVAFSTAKPQVDEETVKESLVAEGACPTEIADSLAELKARGVSRNKPGAYVIGADQILWADGQVVNKPATAVAVRDQLVALRGSTHELHTAVCIARESAPIWRHNTVAKMKMRRFSDAFLDWYINHAGPAMFESVGGYRLESVGMQLFDGIEGDYFAILGLPLLPLLDFLREHELVMP